LAYWSAFLGSYGEGSTFPAFKLHKTIPEMQHNKTIVKFGGTSNPKSDFSQIIV
jgi:hypothetical protein